MAQEAANCGGRTKGGRDDGPDDDDHHSPPSSPSPRMSSGTGNDDAADADADAAAAVGGRTPGDGDDGDDGDDVLLSRIVPPSHVLADGRFVRLPPPVVDRAIGVLREGGGVPPSHRGRRGGGAGRRGR